MNLADLVDGHVDRHAQIVLCIPKPRTCQRDGKAWMAGDRHRDQIEPGIDLVGRIVVDPAGAGEEHL